MNYNIGMCRKVGRMLVVYSESGRVIFSYEKKKEVLSGACTFITTRLFHSLPSLCVSSFLFHSIFPFALFSPSLPLSTSLPSCSLSNAVPFSLPSPALFLYLLPLPLSSLPRFPLSLTTLSCYFFTAAWLRTSIDRYYLRRNCWRRIYSRSFCCR
jgi:hypothetical protein